MAESKKSLSATPVPGATVEHAVSVNMSPQDFVELYNRARELWASVGDDDHGVFLLEWRGSGCRVRFYLDGFRTAGVFGEPGSVVPPFGTPTLTKDEADMVKSLAEDFVLPSLRKAFLDMIGRLTGKAHASNGDDPAGEGAAVAPPASADAPESTASAAKGAVAKAKASKGK